MKDLVDVGEGFWSIRGQFRVAGVLNVGTQASLVALSDGRFILLDSYTLGPTVLAEVERITGGADKVAAILNLHPFHTLHVEPMHAQFPSAALYGTARHRRRFPHLPWQDLTTEDPKFWPTFDSDLDFTVPRGVAFIPANEQLHFASVMAYHRPSKTIHVDDTFNALPPRLGRMLGRRPRISFHQTLAKVLDPRPGAVDEFRAWAEALSAHWGQAKTLCIAHNAVLTAEQLGFETIAPAIREALRRVEPTLKDHAAKHG